MSARSIFSFQGIDGNSSATQLSRDRLKSCIFMHNSRSIRLKHVYPSPKISRICFNPLTFAEVWVGRQLAVNPCLSVHAPKLITSFLIPSPVCANIRESNYCCNFREFGERRVCRTKLALTMIWWHSWLLKWLLKWWALVSSKCLSRDIRSSQRFIVCSSRSVSFLLLSWPSP